VQIAIFVTSDFWTVDLGISACHFIPERCRGAAFSIGGAPLWNGRFSKRNAEIDKYFGEMKAKCTFNVECDTAVSWREDFEAKFS
jgi:hypothetical protein